MQNIRIAVVNETGIRGGGGGRSFRDYCFHRNRFCPPILIFSSRTGSDGSGGTQYSTRKSRAPASNTYSRTVMDLPPIDRRRDGAISSKSATFSTKVR